MSVDAGGGNLTILSGQRPSKNGGIRLTFTGQYLNVSQQPTLQFNIGPNAVNATCQVDSSGTSLVCLAPPLTELNDYTVIMDAAPGPDTSDNDFSLMLVDDPVATGIREEFRRVNLGVIGSIIIIKGERINNVDMEEIIVMVGQDQCVVQTTGATIITCVAPQRNEPVMETVIVMFGLNINNTVGMLEYGSAPSNNNINIGFVVGGAVGGVIVLALSLLIVLVPVLCCFYSSISKYKVELRKAQHSVNNIIISEPAAINNVSRQSSKCASSVPTLNPAYTKPEDDNLYEEVHVQAREIEKALATEGKAECEDNYNVIDDLHPHTEQHRMNDSKIEGIDNTNVDVDDQCYEVMFADSKEVAIGHSREQILMKTCKSSNEYVSGYLQPATAAAQADEEVCHTHDGVAHDREQSRSHQADVKEEDPKKGDKQERRLH